MSFALDQVRPPYLPAGLEIPVACTHSNAKPLIELTLAGAAAPGTLDLRPGVPLVLAW